MQLRKERVKALLSTQGGDTIVEVLVCIAVISLVLVASYASINTAYKSSEDTQEHTQAVSLIETQIEELRSYTATPAPTFPPYACFSYDSATSTVAPAKNNGGNPGTNPCIFQSDGAGAISSSVPAYTVAITQSNATPTAPITYTVTASWQGLFSSTDTVSMEYRTQ